MFNNIDKNMDMNEINKYWNRETKLVFNSKDEKDDEKPKIVIRMNKEINKYWNPETKLVFKSKEEIVVIGNYVNDTLNKLTDDDIAVCEKYAFKYEKEENAPITSFVDELKTKVITVRNKIKTNAINCFIKILKESMNYAANMGKTNGSISLRINLDEDDDYELYKLNELLILTGEIGIYEWLIKEIIKTDVFKGIYFEFDKDVCELEFHWYLTE
jgi:hypothetical protein